MNRIVKIILVVLLSAGLFVISAGKIHIDDQAHTQAQGLPLLEVTHWNKHVVDSAVSILKSGYVVLRTGLGADSYLLAQMNRKDKTYSHCGIVMIEHGYPFVYHSIGGEDNPDERLRRDSASLFFSPVHNAGLAIVRYDFDERHVNKLRQVVSSYYQLRPKFDLQFDLKTDDQLYCSEFVYKAVNKAMNDTAYIRPTRLFGRAFVGIDNLFMNEHAHIVWGIKFK